MSTTEEHPFSALKAELVAGEIVVHTKGADLLILGPTSGKIEQLNLRPSEIAAYVRSYGERIIEEMKLPSELTVEIKDVKGNDYPVTEIKITDSTSTDSDFKIKWGNVLGNKDTFKKAARAALSRLGDPEVHDREGNAVNPAAGHRWTKAALTTDSLNNPGRYK